mgnify:CR=1 FL=1
MTQFDDGNDWSKPVVVSAPKSLYLPLATSAKDAAPWRLHNQGSKGANAFSAEHVEFLSQKYDLDREALWELSRQVGRTLSESCTYFQPELTRSRTDKATKEIQKAIKHIETAERELRKTGAILETLHFGDLIATTRRPKASVEHRSALQSSIDSHRHLKQHIVDMAVSGKVIFDGNPDKRRLRDLRRASVCGSAFAIWAEHGRKISYTSDAIKSERTGPLIEFINDIVSFVTDPPTPLSGETIKTEISAFVSNNRSRRSAQG